MHKEFGFAEARNNTIGNLKNIIVRLSQCVEEGMVDVNDTYYNELLVLEDEASLSKNWDELIEVITRAKILEVEVAAWFSQHGRTSISLPWPKHPVS